mgnify:CR=1 FL=1
MYVYNDWDYLIATSTGLISNLLESIVSSKMIIHVHVKIHRDLSKIIKSCHKVSFAVNKWLWEAILSFSTLLKRTTLHTVLF